MLNITDLMQLASEKNVAFEIHRYDPFNPDYIEMEVIFAGFRERIMVWTHDIAFQDDKARLEKEVAEQVIVAINRLKAAAERECEVCPDLMLKGNERLRQEYAEYKAVWDEEAQRLAQEKEDALRKNIERVGQEIEDGRERRLERGLWCDNQVQATDGTVQCVAHLHEWKFFDCPYRNPEECQCTDYRPLKGDQDERA